MSILKSCGVLVVRGDPIEAFLLMRHADRWDLPKGHVDPGESEQECALRELEEETGIQLTDIDLDPEFRFWSRYTLPMNQSRNPGQSKELVIFLGRLRTAAEIVVTEHLGHEWIDWSPPHSIQEQTIDPLLASVDDHLRGLE